MVVTGVTTIGGCGFGGGFFHLHPEVTATTATVSAMAPIRRCARPEEGIMPLSDHTNRSFRLAQPLCPEKIE